MLAPHDRRLLFDLLRPPEGYRMDAAVGATYSLDLLAMLITPLAFTLFDFEAKDGRIVASPFALLESLRRHADRMTLFCHAGQIHAPGRHRPLFGYLERSIVEVLPPAKDAAFHPKLWLLRLVPSHGEPDRDWPVLYRLLCPSRNLTFDRSWDTMLVLEGPYRPGRRRNPDNVPLANFLAGFPALAVRGLSSQTETQVQRMAEELPRVWFDPPEGFDGIRFWPLGLDATGGWPFEEDEEEIERLLVVSPFLSDKLLQRLSPPGRPVTVVSRGEALMELHSKTLDRLEALFTLDPAAEVDQEDRTSPDHPVDDANADGPEELEWDAAGLELSGLHAKVYIADAGEYGCVWTGSANATDAAFGRNVELLVQLWGSLEDCGVDAMLDPDQGRGFRALLQPFVPPEREPPDADEEELQRQLDQLQRAVASHGLRAVVTALADEDLFDLRVEADGPLPEIWRTAASVACRPVTVQEHWRQRLDAQCRQATFTRLALERITAFFVFDLQAEFHGRTQGRQFVVNLPLINEPDDRRERLMLSLLQNSDQVMRYLLLLLADDGWDARQAIEMLDGHRQRRGPAPGQGPGDLPLLESLLRALTKNPTKLDRIAQLIDDLSKTPQGRALIPAGFLEVWEPVWQAREGITP